MNLLDLQSLLFSMLASSLPAAAVGVYTWIATRGKEAETKVADLRKDVEKKVADMRTEVKNVADALDARIDEVDRRGAETFHELDKGLSEVRGEVRTINVTLLAQTKSLERIENFLIESAKARRA